MTTNLPAFVGVVDLIVLESFTAYWPRLVGILAFLTWREIGD